MTMTLEQIEGMRIPVGTPIEIGFFVPGDSDPKKLCYFESVYRNQENRFGVLRYGTERTFPGKVSASTLIEIPLSFVMSIQVLKYQESNQIRPARSEDELTR